MNKATKLLLGLSLATSTVIGNPKFDKKNDIKHSASTELFESIQTNTVKDSIDYESMIYEDARSIIQEYGESEGQEIIRKCLLNQMNKERKKPLQLHDGLNYMARWYAYHLYSNKLRSHTGKDGSTPFTRAKRIGYYTNVVSENLAFNVFSIQQAMDGRKKSRYHYENIIDKEMVNVGIGFYDGYRVVLFGGKENK